MQRIKYYLGRLLHIDYKSFFKAVDEIAKRSHKSRIFIFFDIIRCSILFGSGYVDYKLFYFEDVKDELKKTYVTRTINNDYFKLFNNREYYKYFNDKDKFLEKFKDFTNRDFINIKIHTYEEYLEFVKKHSSFMAKPVDQSGGYGVEKIKTDKNTDLKALYDVFMEHKQYLLEELVEQVDFMNKLYPCAVNTIRLVTVRYKEKTHIVCSVIRIGNNGNAVDNFHSEGMFSTLDENGIINKPAMDRSTNLFTVHPYTNTPILGFKVENYDELIEFVTKASEVVPEVGYVGWDVAISTKGPVLIEGNHLPGYDVYQSKIHLNDDGTGKKPVFDKIIYGE